MACFGLTDLEKAFWPIKDTKNIGHTEGKRRENQDALEVDVTSIVNTEENLQNN